MHLTLGRFVILVKDYDEAYSFYRRVLHCKKLFDSTSEDGQRFLHIGFEEGSTVGIWLLKADTPEQLDKVGKQTANQPTFVLYTNRFDEMYKHLQDEKVKIAKKPLNTSEYKFLHFNDLYGNEIVLVGMAKQ